MEMPMAPGWTIPIRRGEIATLGTRGAGAGQLDIYRLSAPIKCRIALSPGAVCRCSQTLETYWKFSDREQRILFIVKRGKMIETHGALHSMGAIAYAPFVLPVL